MVIKGTIMKEEKNYLIVLNEKYEYIKIKKKGISQLGKEIMFLEDDIIKDKSKQLKKGYGFAAVIALIVITTMFFSGLDLDSIMGVNAYAIVSLDINPSVEFKINKDNIVKEIIPINKDGEDIINQEMIGMKIEDAIFYGIQNAIQKEYLTEENNMVLISKVSIKEKNNDDTDIKEKVIEKIEESDNTENIKLVYFNANQENLKKAEENNVSIGKYELYQKISEKNKNISIDQVKEMKVTEIINKNKSVIKIQDLNINKKNKEDKENNKDKSNKDSEDTKDSFKQGQEKGNSNGNKDKKNDDDDDDDKDKSEKNKDKGNNGNGKNKDEDSDDDDEDNDDDDEDNDDDEDDDDKDKSDKNNGKGKGNNGSNKDKDDDEDDEDNNDGDEDDDDDKDEDYDEDNEDEDEDEHKNDKGNGNDKDKNNGNRGNSGNGKDKSNDSSKNIDRDEDDNDEDEDDND